MFRPTFDACGGGSKGTNVRHPDLAGLAEFTCGLGSGSQEWEGSGDGRLRAKRYIK